MDPNIVTVTAAEVVKHDPTALYYTYSTIAQTLAAAFAFVGAFVLYQMQSLRQRWETTIQNSFKSYSPFSELTKLAYQDNWDDFFTEYLTISEQKHYGHLKNGMGFLQLNESDQPHSQQAKDAAQRELDTYKSTPGSREHRIQSLIDSRKNLITGFKIVAWFSAITIVMSLTLLPFSRLLCNYNGLTWVLLGAPVVLSIYCIISCVMIIIKTVSVPSNHPQIRTDI